EQMLRFRDLNALLESGIIQTVRQLKGTLEDSFFHPGVLATIAPYNATFGSKFDELFRAATKEIKDFAGELEDQGGTILGSVDHVKAMDEDNLLMLDYGHALDKFRRVSKLKQTLEQKPPMKRGSKEAKLSSAQKPAVKTPSAVVVKPPFNLKAMRKEVTPQQVASEETKLLKVEESVRIFVRV